MKANDNSATSERAFNIVPLSLGQRTKPELAKAKQRFSVQKFTNRTGSKSWKVSGTKRDGERIRENFSELQQAECRRLELEVEFYAGHADTAMRATKLSHEQVQLCEVACVKMGDDWHRILDACDHWKRTGNQAAAGEAPRLDDAVGEFRNWLEGDACTLREHSRTGPRVRLGVFSNSLPNLRVNEITPEVIEKFLAGLKVSPVTRDNYRRDISGFFTWAIDRPRRWLSANPAREVHVAKPEKPPPAILTIAQCRALLKESEKAGLAAYTAVALFAGLRPFEISRLTWDAVNLNDREIRLESINTKTGKPRVVSICPTLLAWLKEYKGQEFFPSGWHKRFRAVKKAAGLTTWPVDVMRHTSVSHFFRQSGSYGLSAEQFGNSEAVIKMHYQGRASTQDTKKFYAIRPHGKATR